MVREMWRFCVLVVCLTTIHACSVVSITSDPTGAEITYSPTGSPPWKPWPPKRALARTIPARNPTPSKAKTTPAHSLTRPEPYYYVRVEKEDCYPVPPKFVDVGLLRRQRLHFELEPTPQGQGFVWHNERWVRPEDEDLVWYQGQWTTGQEKTEREQRDKGLVYDEETKRWMPPQEKQELVATRMRAKGLEASKGGRWLTPAQIQREKLIDDEVQRLAGSGTTFPLTVERIGSLIYAETTAELVVRDSSGRLLELLLSGPQSHSATIDPFGRKAISAPVGAYRLVIREVNQPTAPVSVGTVNLTAKTRYLAIYQGGPRRGGVLPVTP